MSTSSFRTPSRRARWRSWQSATRRASTSRVSAAGATEPCAPPDGLVRIATWNVNSLKARLDKVEWWLARARPDVLLMQETKLADTEAPGDVFRRAGYALAHHGEGRWNGVAIASRGRIEDGVPNVGEP